MSDGGDDPPAAASHSVGVPPSALSAQSPVAHPPTVHCRRKTIPVIVQRRCQRRPAQVQREPGTPSQPHASRNPVVQQGGAGDAGSDDHDLVLRS